ncbi:hypothetical protein IM720_15470 [Pseudomonas fluorescens]|uniref:Uncharacterized protein n=1 Tax=Pseudomonas fluorescens TaxID=294 RepID=A0A7M2JFN6_PSEFL|nr:hypothetical protein IM720_15470 [Pseudomonas fluorescens]
MSDLPVGFSDKDAYTLGLLRTIQSLTAAVCSDSKMRAILQDHLGDSLQKVDKRYTDGMIAAYRGPILNVLDVVKQVNDHIASKKS